MVWLHSLATGGREMAAVAFVLAAASGSAAPGNDLLGGTDLLRLLVLAFGGALVVGNVLALVRPPSRLTTGERQGPPPKPPLGRSVAMITIGSVAVIWAVATLTS